MYLGKDVLTQEDMDAKGKYSSSVYIRRFGNWTTFLKKIGETIIKNICITDEELLDEYIRISKEIIKTELSGNDIRKYSKYSLSTYLDHFGKWNNVKIEVEKYNCKRENNGA
jgi:hypothetical protein